MASALITAIILIHSTPLDEIAILSVADDVKKEQPLSLEGGKTIQVSQFVFVGNKSIDQSQLQRLVSPYVNRSLSMQDLNAIKQRVILFYESKGYKDARVMIPKTTESGVLKVVITEGKRV